MKQRTIEFRVWNIKKKFFDDDIFPMSNGQLYESARAENYVVNNDDYVIQQFTGLTDKNGKKIFEGDIVKFYNFPKQTPLEIVFLYGCFTYKDTFFDFEGCLFPEKCEVISSIFENPELINK